MPRGAAVIRYEGARGVVWRVKYRDAAGQQVQETLGRERDGWTRRKAEAELRHRLADVEREGKRRVQPVTFDVFAREWLATYPDLQALKRSTRESYKTLLERHLIPALGQLKIDAVTVGHLDAHVAAKRKDGYSPASLNRQLNLVSAIYKAAIRRGLARANPVASVERPREPRRRWTILTPHEVAAVDRAFHALADEADGEERTWREQARIVFLTVVGLGLRRGEVLGLRWRNVYLADPAGPVLRVAETWVRGGADTPKSEAGERTVPLGPTIAAALWEHRGRTSYQGDGELVFCHPTKGAALDHKRYAGTFRLALAKAGVDRPMRPFHDGRHTAITNAAAAGNAPAAIQAQAGHADFSTTQRYIDLAGVVFREEAERSDARLFGGLVDETRDR